MSLTMRNEPSRPPTGFTLERWLAYPHILVSGRGDTRAAGSTTSSPPWDKSRRVGIVVPSFLMVPPLLEDSDLIAMMPRHCLPPDAAEPFPHRPDPPMPGRPASRSTSPGTAAATRTAPCSM
jgi:DNA-binding transcriptional LysR family regulator